jgi:hypothetical protein
MGIEEEEMQAKGLCNIFHKIIAEKFPNLEKEMPIQVCPFPGGNLQDAKQT